MTSSKEKVCCEKCIKTSKYRRAGTVCLCPCHKEKVCTGCNDCCPFKHEHSTPKTDEEEKCKCLLTQGLNTVCNDRTCERNHCHFAPKTEEKECSDVPRLASEPCKDTYCPLHEHKTEEAPWWKGKYSSEPTDIQDLDMDWRERHDAEKNSKWTITILNEEAELFIKSLILKTKEEEREKNSHKFYCNGWEAGIKAEKKRILAALEERLAHWKKVHDEAMPNNTLIGYHADSCRRALTDIRDAIEQEKKEDSH